MAPLKGTSFSQMLWFQSETESWLTFHRTSRHIVALRCAESDGSQYPSLDLVYCNGLKILVCCRGLKDLGPIHLYQFIFIFVLLCLCVYPFKGGGLGTLLKRKLQTVRPIIIMFVHYMNDFLLRNKNIFKKRKGKKGEQKVTDCLINWLTLVSLKKCFKHYLFYTVGEPVVILFFTEPSFIKCCPAQEHHPPIPSALSRWILLKLTHSLSLSTLLLPHTHKH